MQHENENEIRWSLRNYQLKLFYSKPKCHLFKTHTPPHSSQSHSKQHSTKQLRCTLWQPKLDFPCTINQLNNPSDLRKRSRINWYPAGGFQVKLLQFEDYDCNSKQILHSQRQTFPLNLSVLSMSCHQDSSELLIAHLPCI